MENIIIPNPREFEKKKQIFKNPCSEKLHLSRDFNRLLIKTFKKSRQFPEQWIRK